MNIKNENQKKKQNQNRRPSCFFGNQHGGSRCPSADPAEGGFVDD